eukprot:g5412.t1
MRGTKGVPIVSKSLIELAEARREREAREESEESDLDSTSSSLTSEAAHGRHDVGGRIATKGVMRVSNVRSALPASPPVVTFRSPAESLSDSPPALLAGKSESGGGRGEAIARQSAGEESSSAKLYPYAAFSSKNKRESQSKVVKPPELCRSDQDTVGSGAKSTEGTVGTPGVMGKGGTPSTPQDTMATQGKDVDTVKQAPLFKARIEISGGAAETLDEGASITSESTLEKLVPELDGSATKPEESKQGRFEAECERPNDELSQKGTGEQQSGDQEERIGPQPCEPAGGAEKEKMCETEGTRRAEGATMALSADASDREEHLDGHDRPVLAAGTRKPQLGSWEK